MICKKTLVYLLVAAGAHCYASDIQRGSITGYCNKDYEDLFLKRYQVQYQHVCDGDRNALVGVYARDVKRYTQKLEIAQQDAEKSSDSSEAALFLMKHTRLLRAHAQLHLEVLDSEGSIRARLGYGPTANE